MGFFKKIRRAIKKVARAVKKVATFLVKPVSSPFSTTQSIPQTSGDQGPAQLDGTLVNFQGGSNMIPLIYGIRKIGGHRVYVATNGKNNKYLYVAMVFCEGGIVRLQQEGDSPLWIDDTNVPLSSYSHGVVAEPTEGPYKDRLKVQFFDGRNSTNSSAIYKVDPDTGDTGAKEGVFSDIDGSGGAPGWTNDHRLTGLAWYAMRFEWKQIDTQEDANNNPYKGIPNVKVRVNGKVIFNAETIGSNHGRAMDGSDPLRSNQLASYERDIANNQGFVERQGGTNVDSSSGDFGTNPINVLLDYLRNPRYGKGLDDDKIDWDSFRDAARLLQQTTQQVKTPTHDGAVKLFTCPIYIDTSQSILNNINIILQSFRGMLPYVNGRYKVVIEGTEDIVMGSSHLNQFSGDINNVETVKTFTDDNIVGGITIERPDRSSRFNRVRITFSDGTTEGATTEAIFPPDGSDYDRLLAEDNGEKLEGSFTIPWCTFEPRAHLFAQLLVRKSRNNTVISFATNLGASDIIPSNLIRVVNTAFGIDGPFRVIDLTMSQDGLIVITCVEHQPSIYVQDLNNFNNLGTQPVLNLPDPFSVETVNTPIILEGGEGFGRPGTLKFSWGATDDPFLDRYVVLIKKAGEPTSAFQEVGRTQDTKFFIENLTPGQAYVARVFVLNTLDRRSDGKSSSEVTFQPSYTPAGGSATAVTTNKVTTTIGTTQLGA